MADVLSLGLFEQRGRVLAVRRKDDAPPFAGMWLLPAGPMGEKESAEEALQHHAFRELGVEIGDIDFGETLYLEDEAQNRRYVATIFRVIRFDGDLRFRAAGDYDDARWLTNDELSQVSMPPALRDWLQSGRLSAGRPGPVPVAAGPAPSDNRAAWNTISRAYQERYQLSTDSIEWGPRCPDESQLGLLGDVSGLRVVVIGCGGGQDCIALAKQGAQVIGIDLSDKQIEYGRRLAERESVLVTLLQGSAEHLSEIEDESQDLAVSVHAMNYVEHADRAFAEVYRVLKPGSRFVLSLGHPFNAALAGGPPFEVKQGYWDVQQDWQWDFPEKSASARFRSWDRPVSEWFALLRDAGFGVEELLEPQPVDRGESTWDGSYNREKMRLTPATLIMKVIKP